MQSLTRFAGVPTTHILLRPSPSHGRLRKSCFPLRAELSDETDPFLRAAIEAASLRYQETLRPEPLLVDPYAGCFASLGNAVDMKEPARHYCVATKYIDDKLLHTLNHTDGLKQVVLLTDGMDTRAYRLNWPTSTMIFEVSPDEVYRKAAEKLEGVGAKIPRSCLFLHIPLETYNIEQALRRKGFSGNQPSIWVIQGLPLITLASFEEILAVTSSMAMKGSLFLGELPAWLEETEIGMKFDSRTWMEKLFMSNSFRVDTISYEEAVRNLGEQLTSEEYRKILFVAEKLRYSDDQMETWRREFQRVEEEGDEEGFEEL